jgi:Mg2+/Co2+ transporter CorB
MAIKESIIEAIKHIIAKGITVAATIIVANNGVNVVITALGGKVDAVAMQALGLAVAYGVWTQAIVPIVNELLTAAGGKAVGAGGATKSYFNVV